MGDKILLLLSASDAHNYFDYESVREQFKDYDLAVVNYMPVYSMDKLREYRPKYFVAMDTEFYHDDFMGLETINTEKVKLVKALEQIVRVTIYFAITSKYNKIAIMGYSYRSFIAYIDSNASYRY